MRGQTQGARRAIRCNWHVRGLLSSAPFAKCQQGSLGSPTVRVVLSPAKDCQGDLATPASAAGDKEAPTNANAPTRVWLGDLPQGVSLQPDCVHIGRNMGKHIRSVGWWNPFCCGRHPTAAKRQAVASFRRYLSSNGELLLRLEELGGKRLACHCPSGVACPGDALIEAWLEKYGHRALICPHAPTSWQEMVVILPPVSCGAMVETF